MSNQKTSHDNKEPKKEKERNSKFHKIIHNTKFNKLKISKLKMTHKK